MHIIKRGLCSTLLKKILSTLLFFGQISSSLETEPRKLLTYSPVLVIQGVVGAAVTCVKVATLAKLIEAGATIVAGIDRLFKIYCILNMEYP